MYEFLHDCIKEKYDDKAHLCHMDTDSFIINTFWIDMKRFKGKFSDSTYKAKRILPIKEKKVIGFKKHALSGKISVTNDFWY